MQPLWLLTVQILFSLATHGDFTIAGERQRTTSVHVALLSVKWLALMSVRLALLSVKGLALMSVKRLALGSQRTSAGESPTASAGSVKGPALVSVKRLALLSIKYWRASKGSTGKRQNANTQGLINQILLISKQKKKLGQEEARRKELTANHDLDPRMYVLCHNFLSVDEHFLLDGRARKNLMRARV